jgi:hypothetical protein
VRASFPLTEPTLVIASFLLGPAPLVGCVSYTERTASAQRDFQGGRFAEALAAYADPERTGSPFLAGAEAGTVALTMGDWEAALLHYSKAAEAVREVESRALAGPERLAETLGSWVLNDTARSYPGEGFERVYLHCSLAQAYLALGKVDDVYVEARLANQLLESEEQLYETEYAAGGWGHFVSAVTYELIGQPDQAFIDYQRMKEKSVGTALAGRALVRLAGQLGRSEDLRQLVDEHGPDGVRPQGAASVVVLGAIGLGPVKVESALAIPTPDGVLKMAVPHYVARPTPVTGLRLMETASQESVATDLIESVTRVAVQNLEDRLAWMAAKSVARGILKRELTQELEEEYDLAGRVAGDLFALLSERADVRAWLTLPDSYQACRLFVAPGVHGLRLEAVGGETVELGEFELDPGETMLVFARTLGPRVYASVIGGRRIQSNSSEQGTEP